MRMVKSNTFARPVSKAFCLAGRAARQYDKIRISNSAVSLTI